MEKFEGFKSKVEGECNTSFVELREKFPALEQYTESSREVFDYLSITIESCLFNELLTKARFELNAESKFQGHRGFQHGGVTMMMHDVVAGLLAYCNTEFDNTENTIVTKRVENCEFKLPIRVGEKLLLEAEIVEVNSNDNTIILESKATSPDGRIFSTTKMIMKKIPRSRLTI